MPTVPPPEQVPTVKEKLEELLLDPSIPKKAHAMIKLRLSQPIPSDIKVIRYSKYTYTDFLKEPKTEPKQCLWIKSSDVLPDSPALHRCVAAYLSDHYLLSTSLLPHGITSFSSPRLEMIASLDHTIWFHAAFRADEWLLFEMESSRTHGGRGLTFGRVYTRNGILVMSCAQEGVIRASKL